MKPLNVGHLTVLASMIVVGCEPSLSNVASTTFMNEHGGCEPYVQPRPDLAGAGREHRYGDAPATYEVTGCNARAIYTCYPVSGDAEENGRIVDGTPAHCSPSGQCTEPGCDSFELATRKAFMKDKACPLERVGATKRAPVVPTAPAEVAADPERMRIWTQTHQKEIDAEFGHTFMTASGCGTERVYDCTKPDLPAAIPICSTMISSADLTIIGAALGLPAPSASVAPPTPPPP